MSTKFYKITYTGQINNENRICSEYIKTKDLRVDLLGWESSIKLDNGEHIVSIEESDHYHDVVTLAVQTSISKGELK